MQPMTTQKNLLRRVSTVAGLTAIAAMGFFTASCANEEEKAPETSTTTTTTPPSSSATVSPTENAPRLEPGGPNPFSPIVYAPPPATQAPGHHSLPGHH